MTYYDIVDIEFFEELEQLYVGYSVYRCEATLSDGSRIAGTIHGDGETWVAETFESEDGL